MKRTGFIVLMVMMLILSACGDKRKRLAALEAEKLRAERQANRRTAAKCL